MPDEAEETESPRWFEDGYAEGQYAADVNLDLDEETANELFWAYQEGRVGEIASEIREHAAQMAGDLSYDVDRPGGPTEEEYESWEDGFYQGFEERVTERARASGVPEPDPFTPSSLTRPRGLVGIRVQPYFKPRE